MRLAVTLGLLAFIAACGGTCSRAQRATNESTVLSNAIPHETGDAERDVRYIEVVGDRAAAHALAEKAMTDRCGPENYTVDREVPDATGASWRVYYDCTIE